MRSQDLILRREVLVLQQLLTDESCYIRQQTCSCCPSCRLSIIAALATLCSLDNLTVRGTELTTGLLPSLSRDRHFSHLCHRARRLLGRSAAYARSALRRGKGCRLFLTTAMTA